jgi:acyl-CoA synthetase (AMP-forming)/AMP-acid ligase II
MAKLTRGAEDQMLEFESTFSLLQKYSDRHPDKTAIVDLEQNKSISFGKLFDQANRIAHFLRDRGIRKGDKIAVLSDENIEKLIIWMGIWRYGAVVCPLNVEMNQAHLREILENIGPKLTLWHDDLDGASLTQGIPGDVMVFSSRGGDGAVSGEFFSALADFSSDADIEQVNAADDLAAIFCTSGTTSKPKSVVYNHLSYWLSGLSTLNMLGLTADDKTLEYRSFGWNSAQILSLMPWLQTGLTLHIAPRFSHSRFFGWIQTHGITFAAGVPTVVNMLLNEPLGIRAADVPSLRLMTCSTAPLSPGQWRKFEDMYGVALLQLYGMSEAGWICGNRHDRRKMGTVGPPAKHQEFLIVDGDGNPCATGIEGEVSVGGPQACMGTISPDGVYEDLTDVRMRTGDLAIMDEDGFVRVTGRTKDLIIRGGVNIAPLEIDNIVLANPAVSEAATIGVPDPIYGEAIVCYVVAKSGETLGEDDLRRHCALGLAEFKIPRDFIIVQDIPKSDRGKVVRDRLKARWLEIYGEN